MSPLSPRGGIIISCCVSTHSLNLLHYRWAIYASTYIISLFYFSILYYYIYL